MWTEGGQCSHPPPLPLPHSGTPQPTGVPCLVLVGRLISGMAAGSGVFIGETCTSGVTCARLFTDYQSRRVCCEVLGAGPAQPHMVHLPPFCLLLVQC
jgi:hypothetical protein